MKRFNKINNSGFTLMEVVIAMALVTIIASFAAAALTANGKGLVKTQEMSLGSDSSLSECEAYLAKDTEHGKTEGNLQFKKTSGGLAGFPDITLEIKDSSDTDPAGGEANVKYVAFKRLGDENDNAGGGGVSADGGGLTSGSGNESGGTSGGTNGGGEGSGTSSEEEERREEPTQAPVTEPATEAPTQTPVTEAPTQTPVTEPQTEAQTQAEQNTPAAGSVYFSNSNMNSFSSQCGWDSSKVIVNGGQMRNPDNVAIDLGYSMISGVTTDGVTLKGSDYFIVNSVHDDSWRGKYYITVYLKPAGGNVNCTINGVTVTEQVYKVPYDENGRLDIRTNGGEVCITGIAVEKFGNKW